MHRACTDPTDALVTSALNDRSARTAPPWAHRWTKARWLKLLAERAQVAQHINQDFIAARCFSCVPLNV